MEDVMAGIKVQLLTAKEKSVCQSIVQLKKGLASKRAAVLLAVNEGGVQPEAAQRSGLTIGQLRYTLTLFKKNKLAMFSTELLDSVAASSAPKKAAAAPKASKPVEAQKPAKVKKEKGKTKKKKSKEVKKEKGKSKKKGTKKAKKNKKSKKK
jgi:hypothetical protein